jgi:hypothetical protein
MAGADAVRGGECDDVVAHVISYDELDARPAGTRGPGPIPDRINAAALARYDTRTPGQLQALLAGHLQPRDCPRRWAAGSR